MPPLAADTDMPRSHSSSPADLLPDGRRDCFARQTLLKKKTEAAPFRNDVLSHILL